MFFAELATSIRAEVHGCPTPIIVTAVRDASIEMCSRTGINIHESSIAISAGSTQYNIAGLPAESELNHVVDIFDGTRALQPVSYNELKRRLGDGDQEGKPKYYAQKDNTAIFVAPKPQVADTLRIIYTVKPTHDASGLPDTIGLEHKEVIIHGALYRLQMMNDQPWSTPTFAGVNKDLFERGVGLITRQVKYGFSGGTLTCKPRPFI